MTKNSSKDDLVDAINSLNKTLKNFNLEKEKATSIENFRPDIEARISRLEDLNEKFSSAMLRLIEKIETLQKEKSKSDDNTSPEQNFNPYFNTNSEVFPKQNIEKPLPRNLNPDLSNLKNHI